MNDHFAHLGLSLGATDADVKSAFERAVKLLHSKRYPPNDPYISRRSRLLSDYIHPAHALLRLSEMRQPYLQSFRAQVIDTHGTGLLAEHTSVRRLEQATSQKHLTALYEQELDRLAAQMFTDLSRYTEVVAQIHQLNVGYIVRQRSATWQAGTSAGAGADSQAAVPTVVPQPLLTNNKTQQQFATANMLIAGGQAPKALQMLRLLRPTADELGQYHRLIGQCYKAMNLPAQAFQEFQNALRYDPQCVQSTEELKKAARPTPQPVAKPEPSRMEKVIQFLNRPL